MHCHRFRPGLGTRREWLQTAANGFGSVALAALLADGTLASPADSKARNALAPRLPPSEAKARNVIFLYMDGGPSQVDTFDPKPRLAQEHGQPIRMKVALEVSQSGSQWNSRERFVSPSGKLCR
jgi:hypothetical protein